MDWMHMDLLSSEWLLLIYQMHVFVTLVVYLSPVVCIVHMVHIACVCSRARIMNCSTLHRTHVDCCIQLL